jgi:hypothetical protein
MNKCCIEYDLPYKCLVCSKLTCDYCCRILYFSHDKVVCKRCFIPTCHNCEKEELNPYRSYLYGGSHDSLPYCFECLVSTRPIEEKSEEEKSGDMWENINYSQLLNS